MLLRDLVGKVESQPMDAGYVKKLSQRKGLKYLEYKDVVGKSMRQLLPSKISGVLILIMDNRKNSNVGHFVLLMRHPRSGVTFFDPYGFGIHQLLRMTHNNSHLERLLKSAHNAHDNRIKYQKRANDIQTCGRHVVTRWNAASLTHKEYSDLMHLPGFTTDEVVTLLTLESDLSHLVDKHVSR